LFSFFGFVKLKIAQITIEKQLCSPKDSKKKQQQTKTNQKQQQQQQQQQ